MTVVWLIVAAFAAGVGVGAMSAARNAHRLVARLPESERVAFARKVRAAVRR